jgi:hypothetical protein
MFHYTFVIDRSTKLLQSILSVDALSDFFDELATYASGVPSDDITVIDHLVTVRQRLNSLATYVQRNNANLKLVRQMVIASALAAGVSAHIADISNPSQLLWVSDRDKLVELRGGIAFDICQLLYLNQLGSDSATQGRSYKTIFRGVAHDIALDPMVRIPDFMVGTAADYDFKERKFSHNKFAPVAERLFTGLSNHAMIYVHSDHEGIRSERRTLTPQP